jgi:ubiquinone/menaquinone biosynthesis C-methylase UbiE
MADAWRSYDSAAATHGRLAAPSIFEKPATDLVAHTGLPDAGKILDVGTGTGIAARVALKLAATGIVVVGVDPSLGMLQVARGEGGIDLAAGALPNLPFPAATFERVLANFVINHVACYQTALLDMARVLRPGGKLGVTTWGPLENEFRQYWQTVAEQFVPKDALRAAVEKALPWEDWFQDPAHLRDAFREAGLADAEIHREMYTVRMPIADFLAIRETSMQARFMRQALDARQWDEFQRTVSAGFRRKFNDSIEHARDVHITVGAKPSISPHT